MPKDSSQNVTYFILGVVAIVGIVAIVQLVNPVHPLRHPGNIFTDHIELERFSFFPPALKLPDVIISDASYEEFENPIGEKGYLLTMTIKNIGEAKLPLITAINIGENLATVDFPGIWKMKTFTLHGELLPGETKTSEIWINCYETIEESESKYLLLEANPVDSGFLYYNEEEDGELNNRYTIDFACDKNIFP